LVDRRSGKAPYRRDELGDEVRRDTTIELEPFPVHPEHAASYGPVRDARDAIEPRQKAQLVESPEGPDVEQHRPITAA
jgi:hypothetical protein